MVLIELYFSPMLIYDFESLKHCDPVQFERPKLFLESSWPCECYLPSCLFVSQRVDFLTREYTRRMKTTDEDGSIITVALTNRCTSVQVALCAMQDLAGDVDYDTMFGSLDGKFLLGSWQW